MSEREPPSNVESRPFKAHFVELVKRALLHAGGLREVEERLKEIVQRTARMPEAVTDEAELRNDE
jgi:hypothetical protein